MDYEWLMEVMAIYRGIVALEPDTLTRADLWKIIQTIEVELGPLLHVYDPDGYYFEEAETRHFLGVE